MHRHFFLHEYQSLTGLLLLLVHPKCLHCTIVFVDIDTYICKKLYVYIKFLQSTNRPVMSVEINGIPRLWGRNMQ